MREFDVYIDGVRLPAWFLRDAETQLGVRSAFYFDDSVVRVGAVPNLFGELDGDDEFRRPLTYREVFGDSESDEERPPVPPFAHLDGHALSFRLLRSEEDRCGRVVRVGSGDENLRMHVPGSGHIERFGAQQWPWLEWSTQYVVYEVGDPTLQMTLEVRRVPLRGMSAALNRGQWR